MRRKINKLRQQCKTFLSKWNDKTLYKTSYITNRELFRYSVYEITLLVLSVVFFYYGVFSLGLLSLMVASNIGKGLRDVYKDVADSV